MEIPNNKFLVLLQAPSLHLHMHVYSWTNLNQNFGRLQFTNCQCGLDIQMTYFLFGLQGKTNNKFWLILTNSILPLRYYTTFKVNLNHCSIKLIHVCKNYHLHQTAGRANILSKYIIYVFFNFGRGFCGSCNMLFPKAPASCCKKILN